MAEGLLRRRLAVAGIDADIRSAGVSGLSGVSGVAVSAAAVEVLAERGIDLVGHVSRTVAADDIAAADLVVGMERRHVREAVLLVPDARAWSFTLRDLVRRAEVAAPRPPGESIRSWAAGLAAGRTNADLLGLGDDGVADPIGRPKDDYERTATELDGLIARLVARLFPVLAAESVALATDSGAKTVGGWR